MNRRNSVLYAAGFLSTLATLAFPHSAVAGAVTTLHDFQPYPDGAYPRAALIQGTDGYLYGTSEGGPYPGQSDYLGMYARNAGHPYSNGTIFKVSTSGVLTTLHYFSGADGEDPEARLVWGTDGNLYGTTAKGGDYRSGTVFKITPSGTFTLLHSFNSVDGAVPITGLTEGQDGNLYGTTEYGGSGAYGTVFSISKSGTLTTLHAFNGTAGSCPNSDLVQLADGTLYGTTWSNVYKIATAGTYTPLHTFDGSTEGYDPGNLVDGGDGYLYGLLISAASSTFGFYKITTDGVCTPLASFYTNSQNCPFVPPPLLHGSDGSFYAVGAETVTKFSSTGTSSTLCTIPHSGSDRITVTNGLVEGADHNFYVPAWEEISYDSSLKVTESLGAILKINTAGAITDLYRFLCATDGAGPAAFGRLSDGNYGGTTVAGGTLNAGTIFKFGSGNSITSLQSFNAFSGLAGYPHANVVLAADGSFYCTAYADGNTGTGGILLRALSSGQPWSGVELGWIGHPTNRPNDVLEGSDGFLYYTTSGFGVSGSDTDYGAILQTTPGFDGWGQATALYTFTDSSKGLTPGSLVKSGDGMFDGVTSQGGADGGGVFFSYSTANGYTVLHSFATADGKTPRPRLFLGSDANFYGATTTGGSHGYGTVFKVTPAGQVTVLYNSTGAASDTGLDNVVLAVDGNVYGTTADDETSNLAEPARFGTIFRLTPGGTFSTVYQFHGADGNGPGQLVPSVDGSLYGITANGGAYGSGCFFELTLAPAVPVVSSISTNNTSVSLSWSTAQRASTYNLYRSTTPSGEGGVPYKTGLISTTYVDKNLTSGVTYYYQVSAVNAGGESTLSTEASATPVAPTVAFVSVDSTTHGNWKGNYGVDGYNVIGDASANNPRYPSYATIAPAPHNSGAWAASSLMPGCLQKAAVGSADRMAGVWYQTTWSVNVNMTGTHQLALYLFDINNAGYAETITIKDAVTGAVLDARAASGFAGGAYYVYNINGNVNVVLTSTAGHWAVLSGLFFGPGSGSKAPDAPTASVVTASHQATLSWTAVSGATSYNMYRGGTTGNESTTPIATNVTATTLKNTGLTPGSTYVYKVVAVNATGGSFASNEVTANIPVISATFIGTDTTTQGNWKGIYGLDGYNVIGDTSGTNPVYPTYATVTPSTHTAGIWAASTSNLAALQKVATGSIDRIAGVWFNTTWSTTVNVTGTHKLALYFLDYPNSGYAETITIKDTVTGAVLDSRSISSFQTGKYEAWNVSGNVTITLTSTAGHWAPLSGIFFG